MNRQITRIAVVSLLLLVALVVATTYWQTWATASLADRQDNALQRVAQFSIRRGLILTADNRSLLAGNIPKQVDRRTLYFRYYPQTGLAAQLVGYSNADFGRAGIERSQNDVLTGSSGNLQTVVDRTLNTIKGTTIDGNDVVLTLDLKAQQVALNDLTGKCGAVVALDPATGKILVMASSPTYNPNRISRDYTRIVNARASCGLAAPLVNRGAAGLYPPGSTFKIVTAAAALDTGKFTLDSRFYDPGYCVMYGKQVRNFGDQNGPEVFGNVSFLQALQHSINSVFCNVGKALGAKVVLDYAKRFGFYDLPPLETPPSERRASGLYVRGHPWVPRNPTFQVDAGRLAFGQERMLATPEQMAMVASAVANRGILMRPYAIGRVVAPDGSTISTTAPQVYSRPIKPSTAADLKTMMEAVVQAGTGTAAQIPGVTVAGKTGTAETGVPGVNQTWFIAFAPADAPKVAIAVLVEQQRSTGGVVAAPIAKDVLTTLLKPGGSP